MPRKTHACAAERRHHGGFNEAAARCHGKLPVAGAESGLHLFASMRPRPDATENRDVYVWSCQTAEASMRPRPDATENCPTTPSPSGTSRFNEAAARCHGKHARSVSASTPTCPLQ